MFIDKMDRIKIGKIVKVEYGIENNYQDVTAKVLKNFVYNKTIYLPDNDVLRAQLLGDPVHGVVKEIIITDGQLQTLYPSDCKIIYNIEHLIN